MWGSHMTAPKPAGAQLAVVGYDWWFYTWASILTMTVGTVFLMWIGEQIDEYGVGNGISLIIMAGIISRIPDATLTLIWHRGWFRDSIFRLGGGNSGEISLEKLIVLIYFFCYFWTAITFNPKDMANNLKDYGSFIPGYRPGKRTADYLEKVIMRITYVGAAFLAVIAIIPSLISSALEVNYAVASFYGGTRLLIVISAALDLVPKINSHLGTRDY